MIQGTISICINGTISYAIFNNDNEVLSEKPYATFSHYLKFSLEKDIMLQFPISSFISSLVFVKLSSEMESPKKLSKVQECFYKSFKYFHYGGVLKVESSRRWKLLEFFSILFFEFLGFVALLDPFLKSDSWWELITKAPVVLAVFVACADITNFRIHQSEIWSILDDFRFMEKRDEDGFAMRAANFCTKWGERFRITIILLLLFIDVQLMIFGEKHEILYGYIIEIETDLQFYILFSIQFLQTFVITTLYTSAKMTYYTIMLHLEAHCDSITNKLRKILKPQNEADEIENMKRLKETIEHYQDLVG
jgi:hypothetical protein